MTDMNSGRGFFLPVELIYHLSLLRCRRVTKDKHIIHCNKTMEPKTIMFGRSVGRLIEKAMPTNWRQAGDQDEMNAKDLNEMLTE